MKLTAKVLKEMIRKQLKENMMGNKAGYYGGSLGMGGSQVDAEDPDYKIAYNIAKAQMEDYYNGFLRGGKGIPEQEVKDVLMNEFGSDPNIKTEEALVSLVSDVMAGT